MDEGDAKRLAEMRRSLSRPCWRTADDMNLLLRLLDEALRDAARYRWLVRNDCIVASCYENYPSIDPGDAIDAQMENC